MEQANKVTLQVPDIGHLCVKASLDFLKYFQILLKASKGNSC